MALSGLFVNMLQRLVTLSRGVAGDGVNKALKPWRTLDGFGRLGAPPAGAQMPAGRRQRDLQAQAHHAARPLRRRERPGRLQHRRPRRRAQAAGAARRRRDRPADAKAARPTCRAGSCWPPLLLLLADLFISLWLRGLMAARAAPHRPCRAAAAAAAAWPLAGRRSPGRRPQQPQRRSPGRRPSKPGPPPLSEEQALKGSLDIRLAYIAHRRQGGRRPQPRPGLEGLSEILRNRTSVEPADPVGLDLEKDEPRLYPLIYWPITVDASRRCRRAPRRRSTATCAPAASCSSTRATSS